MKYLIYFIAFCFALVVLVALGVIAWRILEFTAYKTDELINLVLEMRERSKVRDWKKENLK